MKLRLMATRHAAFYSPFICTLAGGFLEEEGIEASYAAAKPGQTYRTAVGEGLADVMQSAVSASWRDLDLGEVSLPWHFAQINRLDGFLLAAHTPDPNFNWHKLEGRTLIADHGAQPLAMLRYSLLQRGVKLSEVRFLDLGAPDKMEHAFREGQGDYIHLQAPAPQQLEREGVGSVVARVGEGLPHCAFSSVCASEAFLDSPAATAFLRAFGRAKNWVQSAAPMSVAVAEHSYFPGISLPALAAAIHGYQTLGTWAGGTDIHPVEYEQTQAVFAAVGSLPNRYPWEQVCKRLVT